MSSNFLNSSNNKSLRQPNMNNHYPLHIQHLPANSHNGYNNEEVISNIVFNTRFRNNLFDSNPESAEFLLPNHIHNVTEISLSSLQLPNSIFTFSKTKFTTQIKINEAIVTIPDGNYTSETFPDILQSAINDSSDLSDFVVSIDPNTQFITISNSSGDFSMDTIVNYGYIPGKCNRNSVDVSNDNNVSIHATKSKCQLKNYKVTQTHNFRLNDDNDKNKYISGSNITNTLGYQIGFRETSYIDANSYTSESPFDESCFDYIYFSMDDFNKSSNNNTIGILPGENMVDDNILAVVPLSNDSSKKTFDNGSDLIYKTRTYSQPVSLKKLKIKLLDIYGNLLDINKKDYTFVLQVKRIHDNVKYGSH